MAGHAGARVFGCCLALGLRSSFLSWVLQCFAMCLAFPQRCTRTGLSMGMPRAAGAAGVSHPNPPRWHPGTASSAELGVCFTSSSSTLQQRWDLWKLCMWCPLPRSLWYFTAAHMYFVKVCFVNQLYVGWCWENSV